MLQNNCSNSATSCKDCIKNRTLIKKYQKLTHLYQKKQLKLSMNGSSCLSNGKTTNYTLDSPTSEIPIIKLVQVLSQLFKNKYMYFFRRPAPKSAKKLILLNIYNRINKYAKTKTFNIIKQHAKKQNKSLSEQFATIMKTTPLQKQSIKPIKNNQQQTITQSLITQILTKPQQQIKKYLTNLNLLKQTSQSSVNNHKYLQRRNMQLQIQNKKLLLQNQILRESLLELDKRQAKQNQKKRQTLQQLAQQMSQKNQQLQHLRQALKAYEDRDQYDKILEHDVVSIKKQVQHLQKINDRLNDDLQKIKNQMFQTTNKLKQSQERYTKLERQVQELNKNNFNLTCKAEKAQTSQKQLQKFMKLLEKKIKRLNIYQKQLQETINNNTNANTNTNTNTNVQNQSVNIIQQLKSEIILMYLANINNQDYKLYSQNLFDEEEKNLLCQHKRVWRELQNKNKVGNHNNNNENKMDCLEISEIEQKGLHMDSMLNYWDSTKQNVHEVHTSQSREGSTMRIIQLQLENNKQIGKITQLKQKLLHIRVIILKLLKSLQLQGDIKPQAKDILRVLFDLFEYSEQQRENLFAKKKRLFGFI